MSVLPKMQYHNSHLLGSTVSKSESHEKAKAYDPIEWLKEFFGNCTGCKAQTRRWFNAKLES